MEKIIHFFELTRLRKPIGYMLLFWPCIWGLTVAFDFTNSAQVYLKFCFLFFCGSVLMRSAGCIINDIADKDFDSRVVRTKKRPIALGKVSVKVGLFYSLILCLIALTVLLQFNFYTIILALCSMPLAFSYPYMKRFTYWPQLFLGITFNYGLILGWTAIYADLSVIPIVFYLGAIFWTLGYDTIYGFQDIKDDEIIGVKSTSIKFKNNPKQFVLICYLIFIISQVYIGIRMNFTDIYFFGVILVALHLLAFQLLKLNVKSEKSCLQIFKSNNFLGFMVFVNILIGKIII